MGPATVLFLSPRPSAVRFRLEGERLGLDVPDRRLVVVRDDDDTLLGDRVAPPILVQVVPDLRRRAG